MENKLSLSHRLPPEMRGLRTRPRTDVYPPRVELPSAAGGIMIVSSPPVDNQVKSNQIYLLKTHRILMQQVVKAVDEQGQQG